MEYLFVHMLVYNNLLCNMHSMNIKVQCTVYCIFLLYRVHRPFFPCLII
jgi:hypothetical protein